MNPPSELLSERITTILVAQHYFRDGKTKREIAELMEMSRFKIARILDKCLSEGLVEIVFHFSDGYIDYELSADIKTRFGLRHALVVNDTGMTEDDILDCLGRATALLLSEITSARDVLGFAWTRTLEAMTAHLRPLKARAVVQLCGAFPGAGQGRTSIEIVRDVARSIDGQAFFYYAPLLASDPDAATAIRRQTDVEAAHAVFAKVTKAVVTIGAWKAGQSTLWSAVDPALRHETLSAGAVAEICGGIYLDRRGRETKTPISDLTIGIRAGELVAIPDVIGIAFGLEKAAATRAAIAGKMITSLVSHAALAGALLAEGR